MDPNMKTAFDVDLQWFAEDDKKDKGDLDRVALEKSWNTAIEDLKKSLADSEGGGQEEPTMVEAKQAFAKAQEVLDKAETKEQITAAKAEFKKAQEALEKATTVKKPKGKKEPTEETTETETGTETETSESTPAPTKKSLDELVAEGDEEAEIAMDIEPYLKSLAEGIETTVASHTSELPKLHKAVKELTGIVKVLAKAVLAGSEMQKSIADTVEKIGKIDIPSMSRFSKAKDRFEVSGDQKLTKAEVMNKALDLMKAGKIDSLAVTKLEGRLNAGGDIPDDLKPLFAKEVK